MLPGYYASTRRSSAVAPSVSYVSSPTDSSHHSTSTPLSGRGDSVIVSPANAVPSSAVLSIAGTPTNSHPFSNLVTPSLSSLHGSSSLLPPVPMQKSRPFRLTPSENGFSPGLLPGNQVSNFHHRMFHKFPIIFL